MTTRPSPSIASARRIVLAAAVACLLFTAPLRAASDFLSLTGVRTDGFQKWIDEIRDKGFRPVYVNGYDAGGYAQFAGVALKDPKGPQWEARHDLTAKEYQKTFDEMTKQGFRPLTVSGYLDDKKRRFAAVWVKDDKSVAWQARHNLSKKDYEDTLDAMRKQGLRPAHVTGCMNPAGEVRFTALFVGAGDREWESRHDMTADKYQEEIDRWTSKGFRPLDVNVYDTPDGPRFTATAWKDDHAWVARQGISGETYQKEFDKQAADGLRPVAICGYRDGEQVRYAVLWFKQDK